jgi:predicted N-acyltransferase
MKREIASKKKALLGKCGFIHWRKRTCNWTFIVFSFWNKFLKTKVLHQQKNPSKKSRDDFGTGTRIAFLFIELEGTNSFVSKVKLKGKICDYSC